LLTIPASLTNSHQFQKLNYRYPTADSLFKYFFSIKKLIMETFSSVIQVLTAIAGCLAAILSVPLFFAFRWPAAAMWGLKVVVSALSPLIGLIGLFTLITGLATGSTFITLIGVYNVMAYAIHIIMVTRPPAASTGFIQAFGFGWQSSIDRRQKQGFLWSRMIPGLPAVPRPRLQQDIAFTTVPGSNRQLLCDVWQPPEGVASSGVALIYLHGSAFYILDKDFSTRPFFTHLAAQGHVIMDVAYRMAPETDMMGMINDVKRAVFWMKENATIYGVDPSRIVLGGGSAGGTLALLAAFTDHDELFTPAEDLGKDGSVCAVISLYGPTDLEALYYHTNQHLTTRAIPGKAKKRVPAKLPGWMIKSLGKDYHRLGLDKDFQKTGTLAPLLGGHPDECRDRYALFSPVTHVHSKCPPTLQVHGEHDIMSPVTSCRYLYRRLVERHVPVVMHILPQTDHAFDLVLPKISPSAHNLIYDVERFIAVIAAKREVTGTLAGNFQRDRHRTDDAKDFSSAKEAQSE
jgi:acetyl esterase/lipase